MLVIPESVRMTRDKRREAAWLKKARATITAGDKDRKAGLHASDLLDPRVAYWSRKKKREPDERTIFFFLIGRVLHEIEVKFRTGKEEASDEGSHFDKELGIWYSPDLVLKGNVPGEYKTSRSPYEPISESACLNKYESYLEQLLIYMAAMQSTTGELQVLYISRKQKGGTATAPAQRIYKIRVSPEDLKKYRAQIIETRVSIEQALETDDYRKLPLCRFFKCSELACAWWEDCQPEGRYGKVRMKKRSTRV